jgi:hypothetical protein
MNELTPAYPSIPETRVNLDEMKSFEDFDDEPTVQIPRETMHQLVFGEGHAPSGPTKATRNLRAQVDETSLELLGRARTEELPRS